MFIKSGRGLRARDYSLELGRHNFTINCTGYVQDGKTYSVLESEYFASSKTYQHGRVYYYIMSSLCTYSYRLSSVLSAFERDVLKRGTILIHPIHGTVWAPRGKYLQTTSPHRHLAISFCSFTKVGLCRLNVQSRKAHFIYSHSDSFDLRK